LPYFSQVLPQDRGAGFFSNIYQLRPESEGSVTLSSADPFAPVQIRPNYLSSDKDRQVLRQGVKILRDIFKQKAFDGWRGAELSPGPACQSDQAIDDWIAQTADTAYHPTSTCKMGAENDKMAVLDEKLCVRGIESLRVVDASSFPSIPSGNTAAPTMMLAEKVADMIQEKARH
jgi:choline dehydrogenase